MRKPGKMFGCSGIHFSTLSLASVVSLIGFGHTYLVFSSPWYRSVARNENIATRISKQSGPI